MEVHSIKLFPIHGPLIRQLTQSFLIISTKNRQYSEISTCTPVQLLVQNIGIISSLVDTV